MIHFLVPAEQAFGMGDYLAAEGLGLADRVRIMPYQGLPDRSRLDRGAYVFSALDQLSPAMLRLASAAARRLEAEGCAIYNDPDRTLCRFELLSELRRLGRNEFRAVRATDDVRGLRYPVFLRAERTHDGALSPLLHSAAEVEAAAGRAVLQGRTLRELLVVEFCSTADADGHFRKYAAFVVGGRVVPRSLAYGTSWMLKHRVTEFTLPMVLEERDYILGNPHERELSEIFAIAGAEYGRIDYAMKDGRVQTWEINLNPTIGRGRRPSMGLVPAELEPIRKEAKAHFYRGFAAALEAIDDPVGGPSVELGLDPAVSAAARAAPGRRAGATRGARTLRAMLGPAMPLLQPVAGRVLPLLGKAARVVASFRS